MFYDLIVLIDIDEVFQSTSYYLRSNPIDRNQRKDKGELKNSTRCTERPFVLTVKVRWYTNRFQKTRSGTDSSKANLVPTKQEQVFYIEHVEF